MRISLLVLLTLSALSAHAGGAKTLYWCNPDILLKGLEAVLVKERDGKQVLAVYTEPRSWRRWGSVDEHITPTGLNVNQDIHVYAAPDLGVSLNISTFGDTPRRGDFFRAQFTDQRFGFDMGMGCEYLP